MDHILAAQGLRLTYLHDQNAIADLDLDLILDDLSDDTADGDAFPWLTRRRLTDYDHLVLVTDRSTGRYLAFLAANDGATSREDFLFLETAFVTSLARGQNLLRRMIAFAMLRIGGIQSTPTAIAACTRNPLCHRVMCGIASRLTDAVVFPNADNVTINLHAATLAQRIARVIEPNCRFNAATGIIGGAVEVATGTHDHLFGRRIQPANRVLAVLDLRAQDEAILLDEVRRIYRSR